MPDQNGRLTLEERGENPNPLTDTDYGIIADSGEPDPAPVEEPLTQVKNSDGQLVHVLAGRPDGDNLLLQLQIEGDSGPCFYILSPTDPYGIAPALREFLANAGDLPVLPPEIEG